MGRKCLIKTLLKAIFKAILKYGWFSRSGDLAVMNLCQRLSKGGRPVRGPVSLALVSFSSCLTHQARKSCFAKHVLQSRLAKWALWILFHRKSCVLGVSVVREPYLPIAIPAAPLWTPFRSRRTRFGPRELCPCTFLV